jgi:phage FluMu protein Com
MSAITFQCYACNQMLQVAADNAGRKAKCSRCGTILTIPVPAPDVRAVAASVLPSASAPAVAKPPPLPSSREVLDDVDVVEDVPRRGRYDDYDDGPRRRRADEYDVRKPAAAQWDKVKIGFLLTFIGLCVLAGSYAFTLIGMLMATLGVGGMAILVFVRIGLMVMFLGTIAAIVGHVFWLFVTNKRGALGFAIATLAVAGVYLIMQIVHMAQMFGPFFRVFDATMLLAHLLRAAHFMMIAFYLRALAQTLDDRRFEGALMLNITLSGCLAGYDLLAGVIAMVAAPSNPFDFGRGYLILRWILFWLGAALAVVVYVFTLLAVYRGKRLVDSAV